MPLTGGNFGKLRAMLARLKAVPSRIAAPVAERLTEEMQAQYANGVDAYGKPWIPLAQSTIDKKGHDQILFETGATLEGTYAAPSSGSGIDLHVGPNGHWHQEGSPKYRPILPDNGMPAKWRAIIEEERDRLVKS